jgi:hypothetical protein
MDFKNQLPQTSFMTPADIEKEALRVQVSGIATTMYYQVCQIK